MTTRTPLPLPRGLSACAALAVLAHSAPAAGIQRFAIQEIEPAQGLATCVDLDAEGAVVGYVHPSGSIDSTPFVWKQGVMSFLPVPAGATTVQPTSLDDHGTIYGCRFDWGPSGLILRPLAWRHGELRELPGLFDGMGARIQASPSGAYLVTNSLPFHDGTPGWTDEFGWEEEPDFTTTSKDLPMPYRYHAGVTRPLGTFGGSEGPHVAAVNDHGAAVGWVSGAGPNHYDAVLWHPEDGPLLIGSGGRRSARPEAINGDGVVVGTTRTTRDGGDVNSDSNRRPFIWRAGRWEHLVPPGIYSDGEAVDVNDAGQVVGRWIEGPTGWVAGQAWIRLAGVAQPLEQLVDPDSGWSFTHVAAINEAGQVLAGQHVGPHIGDVRWALLTPVR